MKIIFKEIEINNFMSIGHSSLSFDDYMGFNAVLGENYSPLDNAKSNGAGKSSIFEAIVWCLCGETIRGNKDVTNRFGDDGANVSLSFSVDGIPYVVNRYKDHSKHKTNLFINRNGENISGKGIRDTEKILSTVLPELTPSLIGSVIILGQGMPSRFTNNTPSARKEVLEKLTNSDFMIEDLKAKVATRKLELTKDQRECQDNILRLSTEVKFTQDKIAAIVSALNSIDSTDNLQEQIDEQLRQIATFEKAILDNEQSLSQHENDIELARNQYNEVNSNKSHEIISNEGEYYLLSQEGKISAASIGKDIDALEDVIKRGQKITDICPTCGQKLPDVIIPDMSKEIQRVAELREQLQSISQSNERLYQEYKVSRVMAINEKYNSQLKEIQDFISNELSAIALIKSTISQYNKSLNSAKEILSKLQSDMNLFENKKASMEQDLLEHNRFIDYAETKLADYTNEEAEITLRLGVISKFETTLKRDFRGYLLKDIIAYINDRMKYYCSKLFADGSIDFVLDGNNIAITFNEKSYESLSGGEKQKVDIIIQFSIRDMLCSYTGFNTNILVLDEIFDNLDEVGSNEVINLITTDLQEITDVFIISHHAKELGIPYDNQVTVIKSSNGISDIV